MGEVLDLFPTPDLDLLKVPEDMGNKEHTWYMVPLPFDEGLEDILRAWRQHGLASGHSDRTITSRVYTVRRLRANGLDPVSADREELTEWMSALVDSRTGLRVEKSTLATYRAQLRAFYQWLQDTGRREDDPTEKLPHPKPGKNLPRPLSSEQVQAVLAACSDKRATQTRAYVLLACYEGLRVHEIAKIRGEDILPGEILVTGKGGKSSSVPLHPIVADLARSMPSSGWWFPTSSESGHVHRCSVSSAIRRAMDRAKVPGTPHSCRHFYGTQFLKASGGDLRLTQRVMRHSSPATTAGYTQVIDEQAAFTAAKIA